MRGKGFYFFALKEDYIEAIKEVEKKLGGLQYVKHITYKEPKLEIFHSIEDLTNIGTIRVGTVDGIFHEKWMYYIAKKEDEIGYETIKLVKGGYNYFAEDPKGILKFEPSGLYFGSNCIVRGELSTVAEDESKHEIFKELKKAMMKNMRLPKGRTNYVGKSILQNKEKYRLVYGGPYSDPTADYNIGALEWEEKGKKGKK